MALLAWIKSKKQFLKIQEGVGDNLLREDRANGYVDYVLWSVFEPMDIDLDGELELTCLDSGMVCSKEPLTVRGSIPDCFQDAFHVPFDSGDVIELIEEGI